MDSVGLSANKTPRQIHPLHGSAKPIQLTSCVPCEKFILAMFIPALIISLAFSTDLEAGPAREALSSKISDVDMKVWSAS